MVNETRKDDASGKQAQLDHLREHPDREHITTNQGVRVGHTDDSLKAGERGPTLLEDFHFREKLTHFDHERIPERVVHARGSGAHGFFRVYEPMTGFTRAAFLQDPSKRTPVFVRFSTVVGFRGSADTVRDVRGFATKFYTEEGNYDLVGNNMPVFFIQDAITFPDLVHAIKPEQHHQMPQASAAHDTFWDFVSVMPETAHMIMWVLSDRALPRSYRMMEGFGVNTFRFVNADGKGRFVKFHWRPLLGVHSLVWDETQKIAGKDPDFNRRDLWEAIEQGDYPEFEFGVQMIEEEDEHAFDFDILDPTKLWPRDEVPVRWIGRLTLDRNPDNFFAETEQVAFCPANVVPGIDFSNDPLLQGRLFSYLDTQLIRLGGPNFHEIPINRPLAPVVNNQREGYHRTEINRGPVSSFPNAIGQNRPHPAPAEEGGYAHYQEKVEGRKVRARSEKFRDFFSQAKVFWNSMSGVEKRHIVEAFHFELGKVEDPAIRKRVVDLFNNIDGDLAVAIAEGVGVEPPETKGPSSGTRRDPTLSQESTVMDTVRSRRVAVLALDGYDHDELERVVKALTDAGARPTIISRFHGTIRGANGGETKVDRSYVTTASVLYDAVYVPGGPHVEALKDQGYALHFVNEAFTHCKPIGATGAGVDLLEASDIRGVGSAGPGSGEVVSDAGVVTSRNPEGIDAFADAFRTAIARHRHWARETKEQVPA
jgi:catalase